MLSQEENKKETFLKVLFHEYFFCSVLFHSLPSEKFGVSQGDGFSLNVVKNNSLKQIPHFWHHGLPTFNLVPSSKQLAIPKYQVFPKTLLI